MIALRLTPARPWSRLPCALDLQLAEAWVYCTALSASVLGPCVLQHQLSCGLWCTAVVYRTCTSTMVVGTRSTGPLPVPVLSIRYRFATHIAALSIAKPIAIRLALGCAVVISGKMRERYPVSACRAFRFAAASALVHETYDRQLQISYTKDI